MHLSICDRFFSLVAHWCIAHCASFESLGTGMCAPLCTLKQSQSTPVLGQSVISVTGVALFIIVELAEEHPDE